MRTLTTNHVRATALALCVFVTVVTTVGWLLGRDPESMSYVMLAVAGMLGVGEGSNVGKRATTKPELFQRQEQETQ